MSEIIWLESTDSTNAELLRRISTLANLSAVAATSQSAGRGQGDHTWHSAPGENLTCSILLRFPEPIMRACDAIFITRIITLSLLDLLREEGVEAWIKWPNDIWVGDRKICGILIENRLQSGLVTESIVGVGLNLNETAFPADLPNPVSLKKLTGRDFVPSEILERLLSLISVRYSLYGTEAGRGRLTSEFDAVCRHI